MDMPSTSTRLTTEPAKPNDGDLVRTPGAPDSAAPAPDGPRTEAPAPLRSVHTANFSPILQELGIVAVHRWRVTSVQKSDESRRFRPFI
jgi:hypothetical protein